MNRMELTAPCHFGLEAVLKREITDLGYDISHVEDGRVTFIGDAEAIARINICSRTAERVLINVGRFTACTWEELFTGTKEINWEDYIPFDGRFWVAKANTVNSKLFSPSDIQSIMKKAMVERMKLKYPVEHFEESGEEYPVRVFIHNDVVTVGLDTTGASLHKRGYRLMTSKAPIAENLAAALIMLTPWKKDRILIDPFCGSGTFPIEAALMAAGIAPGLNREFRACDWEHIVPAAIWRDAYDEAREAVDMNVSTDIQGYDSDDKIIRVARENAARAGVEKLIHFQRRDVKELSHPGRYGFVITNPPYGERLMGTEDVAGLYTTLGERYRELDSFSMYVITGYEGAEKAIGRKADKNRKIYNGMLKTRFYSFMGPKPAGRRRGTEGEAVTAL